jgi:hypothetical protein
MFTVVDTVDPKCLVPDQLLWAVQGHGIIIDLQFVLEGGEEALYYGVFTAAALGRHAAGDLSDFKQLPIGRGPALAF